jgi:DNA-binding Lrp family transcriptional regulator
MNFTKLEKKIIDSLYQIPIEKEPFKIIADDLGIEEREVLDFIEKYSKSGHIRRLAAVLIHQKAGKRGNAMVAWQVPPELVDEVGRKMSSFDEVSHCYERAKIPLWDYNVYSMIHGNTDEDVKKIARKISEATGIKDYELLFSTREFKKTSPRYFPQEDDFRTV